MLLPQQLEKSEKASEKAYLALKVNITMQGGKVIRDGWAYIGLNTNWEMGKHYTYTLDFSDGAGQDENGKQIISGKDIKLNVKVAPWDAKAVALLEKVITGTNMGYMFQDCISLMSLDLSHFDTSKVTDMSYMFANCSSLTSLDLSHFDTSKVTGMSYMFANCSKLTTLDLSGWDISKVTYSGKLQMFDRCSKLQTIRMVGCSEATINEIKAQLAKYDITSCTIVTE
nr:BspA family leucine-rich repeat surface protein [Segatella copri]